MTFKDRPGQVVKVSPTGLAVVPLAMLLRLIAPELDDVLVPTMHTEHTLWPAQVPNDFEALGIVDKVLDFTNPVLAVCVVYIPFLLGVPSQESIRNSLGVV